MTRKDFELIAATIKHAKDNDDPWAGATYDCLAEALADKLKETNALFNRDRFLRACGVAS